MKPELANSQEELGNTQLYNKDNSEELSTVGITTNGHKVCTLKKVLRQNWCQIIWIIVSSALIVLSAFALLGIGGLAGIAGVCQLPFTAIIIPTHVSTLGNFILMSLGGLAIGLNMSIYCKKPSFRSTESQGSNPSYSIHQQDASTQMTPRERLLTPSIHRKNTKNASNEVVHKITYRISPTSSKATTPLGKVKESKSSVTFVALEPCTAKTLTVDTSAPVVELPTNFSSRPTSPCFSPETLPSSA